MFSSAAVNERQAGVSVPPFVQACQDALTGIRAKQAQLANEASVKSASALTVKKNKIISVFLRHVDAELAKFDDGDHTLQERDFIKALRTHFFTDIIPNLYDLTVMRDKQKLFASSALLFGTWAAVAAVTPAPFPGAGLLAGMVASGGALVAADKATDTKLLLDRSASRLLFDDFAEWLLQKESVRLGRLNPCTKLYEYHINADYSFSGRVNTLALSDDELPKLDGFRDPATQQVITVPVIYGGRVMDLSSLLNLNRQGMLKKVDDCSRLDAGAAQNYLYLVEPAPAALASLHAILNEIEVLRSQTENNSFK